MLLKHTLILLIILSLTACGGEDDSSGNSSISGRIFVANNTARDGDVNDVNTSEQSNNNTYNAQPISNPVTLGGYVNQPGEGPSGRFRMFGDQDDFFEVDLRAGQTIALFVGDQNLGNNDLDLGLLKLIQMARHPL